MTHPALATMVEAAKKATPVQEGDLMRYAHGGSRLAILRGGERTLVADFYHEGDTEFYALANPANILSIDEYVRGLEEKATAIELVREEAAKDNSPFGRSDSLALDRIRTVLGLPLGGKP